MELEKAIVRLQKLLDRKLSYLMTEHAFAVAESEDRGAWASSVLRHRIVDMRLVVDRDGVFVEFRAKPNASPYGWITTDIIRRLLGDDIGDTAALDESTVRFLRHRMADILKAFGPSRLDKTLSAVDKLEKERAKRIFGDK